MPEKKQPSIESALATHHLREAEKQIEIALAKLGKHAGSGSHRSYVGSLREYRNLVKVFLKLRGVTDDLARGEERMTSRRRQAR